MDRFAAAYGAGGIFLVLAGIAMTGLEDSPAPIVMIGVGFVMMAVGSLALLPFDAGRI